MRYDEALADVREEIQRALRLKAEGRFVYTISDLHVPNVIRNAMLGEEVGEVSREVLALLGIVQEQGDERALRKELIQVAALATAWAAVYDHAKTPDDMKPAA